MTFRLYDIVGKRYGLNEHENDATQLQVKKKLELLILKQ